VIKRFWGRITELFTTASNAVSRTMRSTLLTTIRRSSFMPTNDWSRSDYAFWRDAYYCRKKGLEISGLFIKPLVSKIASWSLGRAPEWKCDNEASQEALATWWDKRHADILKAFRAALKQGDSFLVINSDLTVTILRPDEVDPIVAEDDFANIIGWRVTQVLAHPTIPARRMKVIDEYYVNQRIHRVEVDGKQTAELVFGNLLERLPIIHIANATDEGQTFGHAEAEALIEILHRYGEVFEAAIEGNQRQGRPTPVLTFATTQDLDKFWAVYGRTQTITHDTGVTESYQTLSVDLSQLLTVSGAEFQYASPGNFAGDTEVLLGLMFYLILEHTELPEFVFGNAIASSKASAETQMPVFERFIEGRRGDIAGWLVQVAEVVLGYLSLIEPGVTAETPSLQWQKLTQDGQLTLDTIEWAYAQGLLDERTALMLAPVDVEDIDAVLELARTEREERRQQAIEDAQALQPERPASGQRTREIMSTYVDAETQAIVAAAERIVANGI
jgi:hypothetical protein